MPVYSFKGHSLKVVHFAVLLFGMILYTGCANAPEKSRAIKATGDERAIEWAKKVIDSAGGMDAWYNTRYIHWNFFGMRELLWDKWDHKVRIQSQSPRIEAIIDLKTKEGPIRSQLTEHLSKDDLRQKVYEIWINDSYWLVLPFKLLDPGVHLTYLGEDSTGRFEQIQLTFDSVGVTPQNKYILSIDPETARIANWSYFVRSENEQARFSMKWGDYQKYGKIWLSSARGSNRSIHDIWVARELDEEVMNDLDIPIPDR